VFGSYHSVDPERLRLLSPESRDLVEPTMHDATRGALSIVAIVPIVMLICYLGLMLYFRRKGGYRPEILGHDNHDTGPGPAVGDGGGLRPERGESS
jgi:hypothetical protein